ADDLIIAGYSIPSASAFSARLEIPLYYPQTESYGSFVVWQKDNVRQINDEELLNHMAETVIQQQKDGVLISDQELRLRPFRRSIYGDRIKVSLLEKFIGSIVESEQFFIYEIRRRNDCSAP
ncbi:MAG: hypothetical protein AB4042_00940, partial [Leptolyngbyaceae cyanobacterium]